VGLSARLERLYGRPVPIRVIFERPTLESLAAYLRQEVSLSPPSTLVPLRASGSRPPLFCVHPVAGLAHNYVALAERLGEKQPVYAFQSVGLDGREAPHTTIEAMATRYISDLRRVQPHGPYHLAGWSMGAVVAYAMACRLVTQEREDVAFLGLFDASVLSEPQTLTAAQHNALCDDHEGDYLLQLAEQDLGMSRDTILALAPDDRFRRYYAGAIASGRLPTDITEQQFRRFLRVMAINSVSRLTYTPALYPGDVTVFRAAGTQVIDVTPLRQLVVGRIHVHDLPGTHHRFLDEPQVAAIANVLMGCLASTRRSAGFGASVDSGRAV
jgi:thioesterase domain-containing protein